MTSIDIVYYVTQAGSMVCTFLMAPVVLFLILRRGTSTRKKWALWLPLAVIVTWAFLIVYSVLVETPALRAYASEQGDFDADNVGGNVATLVLGWFIPLCGSLLLALVYKKKEPNQQPEPMRMDDSSAI